jgi:hypothetical protein
VNIAATDDAVVLLDWGLATWAPPALDIAYRGDLQLGAEVRIGAPLGELRCRSVRLGVQRVVDALVGPQRGHGDDAVVGLAVATQPLPPDGGGAHAVLAVAGIVDNQYPAGVRRGGFVTCARTEGPSSIGG